MRRGLKQPQEGHTASDFVRIIESEWKRLRDGAASQPE